MFQDCTSLLPLSMVLLIPQTCKYAQVCHFKKLFLEPHIPYYSVATRWQSCWKTGFICLYFPTSYLFLNPMQFDLCSHHSSNPIFTDVTNDLGAKSTKFFSVLIILDLPTSLNVTAFLHLQTLFCKVLSQTFYWFSISLLISTIFFQDSATTSHTFNCQCSPWLSPQRSALQSERDP